MGDILRSPEEYPAIRRAILTDLNSGDLPDSVIGDLPYALRAERWLVSRIPDAETQIAAGRASGASAEAVIAAEALVLGAVLYCAALLCPAVSRMTSISATAGDTAIVRPAFNAEKRRVDLMTEAEAAIEDYLPPTEAPPVHASVFCAVSGRRA